MHLHEPILSSAPHAYFGAHRLRSADLVYSTIAVAWLCNYCLWDQQWHLVTWRFVWLFAFSVILLQDRI